MKLQEGRPIGNGGVSTGVLVRFAEDIKKSYGFVLIGLYGARLRWAYEDEASVPSDVDCRKEIESLQRVKLDYDTQLGQLPLWKLVRDGLGYTFQGVERIILMATSVWNAAKGPSDCKSYLVGETSIDFQRMLVHKRSRGGNAGVFGNRIYRGAQIALASRQLSNYSSLKKFRASNSDRLSYHCTCLRIADLCLPIQVLLL